MNKHLFRFLTCNAMLAGVGLLIWLMRLAYQYLGEWSLWPMSALMVSTVITVIMANDR